MAGNSKAAKQLQQRSHVWLKVLLMTLFFFLLEQVDPFGLSSATETYSRTLVYQVLANQEPSSYRDCITVVMLDDKDLLEFDQHWPAEYGFHAAVLQALSDYQAAAVFIDIAFIDERADDSLDELQAMAKKYQDNNIPLLVAGTLGEEPYREGIRAELVDSGMTVVPVPGGRDDHQGIIYPLWDEPRRGEPLGCKGRPTAAMAIYEALKSKKEPAKKCKKKTKSFHFINLDFNAVKGMPDMEITWKITDKRTLLDNDQEKTLDNHTLDSYTKENCEIRSKGLLQRVWRVMGLPGVDNDLRNPCPYHTTLTLRDLLSGDDRFKSVIEDRVIIYGTDLMMSEDKVEPPTHTPLAAAHLHAMALNNLFDRGSNYRTSDTNDGFFSLVSCMTFLCLLLLMINAQFWESLIEPRCQTVDNKTKREHHHRDGQWQPKPLRHALLLLGWTLSAVLIVSIISSIAFGFMGLGVSNWAGWLFFTLIRAHARLVDLANERALAISSWFWQHEYVVKTLHPLIRRLRKWIDA